MKVSKKLEVRCWFKGDFLVSHYNYGAGFVARGLLIPNPCCTTYLDWKKWIKMNLNLNIHSSIQNLRVVGK